MALTKVKLIADGVVDVDHLAANHGITTDNIGEGTALYYTDARVSSYLTTNSYATEGFVTTAVSNLVASAPSTLDTLNELAAALGDDPNFATTVTNSIAGKLPLTGGTLTGNLTVETSGNTVITVNAGTNGSASLRLTNDAQDWDVNTQTTDSFAIYNQTNSTQPFTILPIGYVGINTDSPNRQLEIYGNVDGYLKVDGGRAGNHGYTLGSDVYGFIIYDDDAESYRMVIDQNTGYIGIGNQDPSARLTVGGGVRLTGTGSGDSQLDLPIQYGALRWYNGSTFRGGLGTNLWSTVGGANDLTFYLVDGNLNISNQTTPFATFDRANGRVGVGITSPDAPMHIDYEQASLAGNSWVGLHVDRSYASSANFYTGLALTSYQNKGGIIGADGNKNLMFFNYDGVNDVVTSESMRLDYNGVLNIYKGSSSNDNIRFYNTDSNYAYIRTTSANNNNNVWFDGVLGSVMWHAWDNPGGARTANTYTKHYFGTGRGTDYESVRIVRGAITGKENSNTDRYTINPSGISYFNGGNVGVGNTNPQRKLHVVDTVPQIRVSYAAPLDSRYAELGWGSLIGYASDTANNGMTIGFNGGNSSNGRLDFITGPSTDNQVRMTISRSGNVGINETTPGSKLVVNSSDTLISDFYSPVADQLTYLRIWNTAQSSAGTNSAAAAIEFVGKADTSTHGRHAWIGAEGVNGTTYSTQLKFKVRGESPGYNWSGSYEAPTRMVIDGRGYVTKDAQPYFNVKISTSTSVTSDAKLLFNSVDWDIGSNFSTANSRFTAPVNGRYLFCLTSSISSAISGDYNAIYIRYNGNGTNFRFRTAPTSTNVWTGITGSAILNIAAGDYIEIWAYTHSGSMQLQPNETVLTGYLLG